MALNAESIELLSSALKRVEFSKGVMLVKEYTVCDTIYFIEKGLTRTYYIKDGKDVTDWLSPENTFACSIISFITRMPDRRIIETLELSVCWVLNYYQLEELYQQSHQIERLGRLLVNSGLIQLQKRFDDLHFASAAERYKTMMQETPTLLQRVPLGIIASYLGITQETLSRIRSQI